MVAARVTINGYRTDYCLKAVRAAIREDQPRVAAFFSIEMVSTGVKERKILFLELDKILYEDISLADMQTFLFATECLRKAKELYESSEILPEFLQDWHKPFFAAIISMCRASRTKLVDYFAETLLAARHCGWRPEIPKYAHDYTTREGREMGEDALYSVETETDPDDCYAELADSGYLKYIGLIREFKEQNQVNFSTETADVNDDLILMKAVFKDNWEEIKNFGENE